MQLTGCVALLWMLSSSATALQCVKDQGYNTATVEECGDNNLCATIVINGNIKGLNKATKSCISSSVCGHESQTFSIYSGPIVQAFSVHCCKTDHCNSKTLQGTVPDVDVRTENGLQCNTCILSPHPASCNMSVKCVGSQDRCFILKKQYEDQVIHTLGCMSANLCENPNVMDALNSNSGIQSGELKCCGTSFCNSIATVRLSAVPLLLGLMTLLVL